MIFVGLKLMSTTCNNDSIIDSFSQIFKKNKFSFIIRILGIFLLLFITLGSNVSTWITTLIGIIGANINSKRTVVIHLTFNICGCLLFIPIL